MDIFFKRVAKPFERLDVSTERVNKPLERMQIFFERLPNGLQVTEFRSKTESRLCTFPVKGHNLLLAPDHSGPFTRAYSHPIDDVSFFPFGEHFLTFGATFFTWRDFFSLARLFFSGATFFLWRDFFLSCATFFSGAHLYTATRFIEQRWLTRLTTIYYS